ncbi:MAG TPA: TatD family hydrolase [Nitriliruptorales bacterium]
MPTYVDTHCHLDMHDDLATSEQVERARDAGVDVLVTVGTSMATSTQSVQTANRFAGVWASVGIHPNDAMEATPRVLEVIDHLAQQDVVVGIGETGLDYYRKHASPDTQDRSFRAHIELAKRHDKALIIHCREAWDQVLDALTEEGPPDRVVMHCYSGDVPTTERCAEAGYWMSFAGNVTFKNAEELRVAASRVPLELLLTETDSPFLSPVPYRGRANDPSRVPYVVDVLAAVKQVAPDELADAVYANAKRAFALPEDPTHETDQG